METKDFITIAISALALLLSAGATTISLLKSKYEKQRVIRSQLSEILSRIVSTNLENAKLHREVGQSDPMYLQTVSSILNQQNTFLLQQAMYLMDQIPGLVTNLEHNTVAAANANAGDLMTAEMHYQKAIEVSNTDYYRSLATRSYAAFLFPQRRFEEGRELFKKAVKLLKGEGNLVRYTNGFTYQMWAWHELNNAASEKRAQELFESALNEFQGIDNELVRKKAIHGLQAAKNSQAGLDTTSGISPRVDVSAQDYAQTLPRRES